ncbi:MAG: DUF86 domain-containing protein [Oscillospiraceae bacterium]|nr:DUF86 domain-containing protein [Oscillospiraceae bacterium]
MRLRDLKYLMLIDNHCRRISTKVKCCKSEQEYMADLDTMEICAFNLMQIGEATTKLSNAFTDQHPDIPWDDIKGLRQHVVHNYEGIDHTVVWETIIDDIPQLAQFTGGILKSERQREASRDADQTSID